MLKKSLICGLLILQLNFGDKNWDILQNKTIINYKDKNYVTQVAKNEDQETYYIYDENNIVGDEENEFNLYKDLSSIAYYQDNKLNIINELEEAIKEFNEINKTYKTGLILNQSIKELTEIDVNLYLMPKDPERLPEYLIEKYSKKLQNLTEDIISKLYEDRKKLKTKEDIKLKLDEILFGDIVRETNDNINRLNFLKKELNKNLSSDKILKYNKLMKILLLEGYANYSFQKNHLELMNNYEYQLVNVGSGILKSFDEGKTVYEIVTELGLIGIEDLDKKIIAIASNKMNDEVEKRRFYLERNERRFNLNDKNSTSSKFINYIKEKNSSLYKINYYWNINKGALNVNQNEDEISDYNVKVDTSGNSIEFDIKTGANTRAFGWMDLSLDLKELNKDIEISFDVTAFDVELEETYDGIFAIGIVDSKKDDKVRYRSNNEKKSSIDYSIRSYFYQEKDLFKKWNLEIYRSGEVRISNNDPEYNPQVFDISGLAHWNLRLIGNAISTNEKERYAKFRVENFKIK